MQRYILNMIFTFGNASSKSLISSICWNMSISNDFETFIRLACIIPLISDRVRTQVRPPSSLDNAVQDSLQLHVVLRSLVWWWLRGNQTFHSMTYMLPFEYGELFTNDQWSAHTCLSYTNPWVIIPRLQSARLLPCHLLRRKIVFFFAIFAFHFDTSLYQIHPEQDSQNVRICHTSSGWSLTRMWVNVRHYLTANLPSAIVHLFGLLFLKFDSTFGAKSTFPTRITGWPTLYWSRW